MGTQDIKRYCLLKEEADKLLETAINKLGLSARAYSRVLKVSRAIADLLRSSLVSKHATTKGRVVESAGTSPSGLQIADCKSQIAQFEI